MKEIHVYNQIPMKHTDPLHRDLFFLDFFTIQLQFPPAVPKKRRFCAYLGEHLISLAPNINI